MKQKIGIIGAGQAGQRIAVALSQFDDVEVKGIVDPKAGREILTSGTSEWRLQHADFFDDDDKMLTTHQYDGIIVAADPISIYRHKPQALARNGIRVPILWERPVGISQDHPEMIFSTSAIDHQSVVSFGRFGLTSKVIRDIRDTKSLGDILDFEIFGTLNCGLSKKQWRQGNEGVLLPVHFLDIAFEIIEQMGCGQISEVSARQQNAIREGISFDEKWEVLIKTSSGVTGRVVGIQYVGEVEHLYPCRSIRVVGTKGAFISSLGASAIVSASGSVSKIVYNPDSTDSRILKSVSKLESFFRAVDKYPSEAPCRGEAIALAECLRHWVDFLQNKESIGLLRNLCSSADASRYNRIAQAVVTSSREARPISI